MANKMMGYVICGYNSVDNLLSEQSSPFRRWTTGSGTGSSYRHHDHRNIYNKQMSEGSPPAGGSAAGVARWALGLEQLLADPAGAAVFETFLAKEYAAENIRFWWSCEQYNNTSDPAERIKLAKTIWKDYLADKATDPVNVDAAARRATASRLEQEPSAPDMFHQVQKQIFNVMKFDSYPRFLRSGVHAECARADLCGLPSPYGPRGAADPDTSTKVKKSASNASDRRRSGGPSLNPWRRGVSRDRCPQPPPTDVVKASQTGQFSLCRVVMPDGATSVVGVDETVSVRQMVDKLLQRRNLLCTTYDVLLKDENQQTETTIDASAPSTAVGGRSVVVERRCVVRVEVGGRCVAVRCRGARRLRHVLRPVLQRYGGAGARAVLEAGRALHPDTLIQDLDGCRLQIVEVSEGGEGRDSDTDSLRDVVFRLHDDDQSSNASTSRNNSVINPAASNTSVGSAGLKPGPSLPGLNNLGAVPGPSVDLNGGPSAGLNGGPSVGLNGGPSVGLNGGPSLNGPNNGRVRAALRPGASLHHHPPDFLENLRETQRRLLPTSGDVTPRTPPPLPPKPTRAPPTLV